MLRSVLVKDHMTKNPVTLAPEMNIREAVHLLIRKDISGAPVLDDHGRLVGVLTERDCMRVTVQADYYGEPGGQVKEEMSGKPQGVGPEQSMLTRADLCISGGFPRYPVVDNVCMSGLMSRRCVSRGTGVY